MKKEKQVRSYQRRTKSGKMVTVREHTAKYEAADKVKEAAKKKGAGKEFEERMTKKLTQLEIPFDKEEEKKVLDEVKETAKKESTKKPTEKKSYSMKEIRSAAKYVMKYSQPSMKSKADPEKLRRAQQIVEQEIPKDKNGKRNLSSYINSGSSDISTDNKPGTKRKIRPVGSGTNGPTPKKSDSPFMKGERKSDRGTYFSTDTLDKEYKNVMSAIKTGDIKQINKARSKYSAVYSHHGDHFEDKKSEAYRKRQTDSIEKKMNALGYDYWGKPLKKNAVNPTGSTKAIKTSTKTTVKSTTSEPAFTAAEFKEWYRGTGSAADKKVTKALRAQLGRAGYRKLEDEAIDNYSSRGHLSMFKRVGGGNNTSTTTSKSSGTDKASTTGKRIKMPDKVREKKRKHEEYLRKVKESGMSIDEYTRLH